ncbi:MAG: cupin domain-containing protein [Pseudomonadota bacterium]
MLKKTILGASLTALLSLPAMAGECPSDQVLETARPLTVGQGPGYDGRVAATIDLTGWRDMGNFMLRTRTLTIPPRGVVAEHTHDDRPAIVHIIAGELVEHNAFCAEPIVHKAGDTIPEFGAGHRHWWENPTDQPVMATSSDVVPFEAANDDNM